jgi:DNA invertase Pin-like site-specific DNA recombinase
MNENGQQLGVLYLRVSSREQLEGYSIPAQRSYLHRYCDEKNIQIVAEFAADESAKKSGRIAFQKMLAFLRAHPDVRNLVVEKTDRLFRNWRDFVDLDEIGVITHYAKESSIIGPASHSSMRFMQAIKVGQARCYVENLSEEVKKGLDEKCKTDGAWPAKAPLFYVNSSIPAGIEIDPETAALGRRLFEEAGRGEKSLGALSRFAFEIGLRTRYGRRIGKSHIVKILTNGLYYGEFIWGGKTYHGKYEPLISRDLFKRVQRALAERSKPKTRKFLFAFTGIITCAKCHGMLSGDEKRKITKSTGAKRTFMYYVCNGCRAYVAERFFDAAAIDILKSLQIDNAISAWIEQQLGAWYDNGVAAATVETSGRERRLTQLRTFQKGAYEDKLSGVIAEDFYRERVAEWQTEIDAITVAIRVERPRVDRATFLQAARTPIELLQTACDLYVTQSAEEKNEMLKIVVSNLSVQKDAAVSISATLRSPFDVLANWPKGPESEDWLWREDSNLRPPD